MKKWTLVTTRWKRGIVLSLAFHWYDGRHLGIRGFDLTFGLLVMSIHISYRTK